LYLCCNFLAKQFSRKKIEMTREGEEVERKQKLFFLNIGPYSQTCGIISLVWVGWSKLENPKNQRFFLINLPRSRIVKTTTVYHTKEHLFRKKLHSV
jgi:hypothetical protein